MGGNEAGRGSGERLAVDPGDGSKLLFGSRDRGLWRSDDRGASWTHVPGFPRIETALDNPTPGRWNYLTQAVGIVFVVFVPGCERAASQRVIGAVATPAGGLYESRDGGVSWAPSRASRWGVRPIRSALSSKGVLFITYGREPGPNTMFDGAVVALDTASGRFENITPLAPDPPARIPPRPHREVARRGLQRKEMKVCDPKRAPLAEPRPPARTSDRTTFFRINS
jgi:hypothetical protein